MQQIAELLRIMLPVECSEHHSEHGRILQIYRSIRKRMMMAALHGRGSIDVDNEISTSDLSSVLTEYINSNTIT